MNGWQFLEKYADVPEAQQAGVVVVMLTTSLNPDDASLAQSKAAVKSFSSKPLTESRLDDVLAENYPEALRR